MSPERIIRLEDAETGLDGFIVLDTTTLGPAFGGIRIASYDTPDDCLADAQRLAAAMTNKCLFHEVPGGGGKAAVNRRKIVDRRAVLERIGDAVEELDGRFFTGPDTGTDLEDLRVVAGRTSRVTLADVSSSTARGLQRAVHATLRSAGRDIAGATVVFQGLGAVGMRAAAALMADGAIVRGADTDPARERAAETAGVTVIGPDEVLGTECDVLSPCALGGVISAGVASSLRCRVVVGAANNVLATDGIADALHARGITFVPDFVANGGGLIHGAYERIRGTAGAAEEVEGIYDRTRDLLDRARAADIAPLRLVQRELRARRETLLGKR